MEKKEVPAPVVIGIIVAALVLLVGVGFWYMNRQSGPTPEESASYVQKNMQQLRSRQGGAPPGAPGR